MWLQIYLFMTGVTAIWMSQCEGYRWRKISPIIGIIGQPAWMITSYQNEQWGIFVLAFFYTAAWIKGIKTYWLD